MLPSGYMRVKHLFWSVAGGKEQKTRKKVPGFLLLLDHEVLAQNLLPGG